MFTPPGKEDTIVLPGYHGGALWGGASFDPDTEWLYVNHNVQEKSTAMAECMKCHDQYKAPNGCDLCHDSH
jgi:glucose dehydrogenase